MGSMRRSRTLCQYRLTRPAPYLRQWPVAHHITIMRCSSQHCFCRTHARICRALSKGASGVSHRNDAIGDQASAQYLSL
eukprot:12049659-Alexandrium_andersonii.AAC.1